MSSSDVWVCVWGVAMTRGRVDNRDGMLHNCRRCRTCMACGFQHTYPVSGCTGRIIADHLAESARR
eukprot:COSAG02_NODE_5553_length_4235_cov_2.251451_3_plen_66_part_00